MSVKNTTYWISRANLNAPRPPLKSMSYDSAEKWISTQSTGNQMFYTIKISQIKTG